MRWEFPDLPSLPLSLSIFLQPTNARDPPVEVLDHTDVELSSFGWPVSGLSHSDVINVWYCGRPLCITARAHAGSMSFWQFNYLHSSWFLFLKFGEYVMNLVSPMTNECSVQNCSRYAAHFLIASAGCTHMRVIFVT